MNREDAASGTHVLHLQNRETLHLSGVEEVISFDDRSVVLRTTLGALSVDGEELRVKHLDTEHGEVIVEGRLCGMVYVDAPTEQKKTRGASPRGLGRLLR